MTVHQKPLTLAKTTPVSQMTLFPGSRTTVLKIADTLYFIASKGAISDATVKSVLALFAESVPFVHNVPSCFIARENHLRKEFFLEIEPQI